jgi:RNA polymerase sigma-70 factor, ECF subfamily
LAISKDNFEAHVLEMLGSLHGVALRMSKNAADAEDLVAETVARAWKARASLTEEAAIKGWLLRILHNTFLSEKRKERVRPRAQTLVEDPSGEEGVFSIFEQLHQPFLLWFSNPEQRFLDELLREDLNRALAGLPEHYRIVVVLADIEGMKYAEIAKTLDLPVGTVRSRLARGRGELQRVLWNVALDHGLNLAVRDE